MYSRWLPVSPRTQKSWRIESFCTHFTWPSAQRGGPFCFIVVSRCPGFGIRHPGPVSGKAEARSPKPEQLTTLLHEGSSSPPTHWHRSRLRGAGRDSRVHFIFGWQWLDAFYMVVTTLTTIGYQEIHPLSSGGRVFNLALIFFGVALV